MTIVPTQNITTVTDETQPLFQRDEINKLISLLLNSCGNGPLLHVGPANPALLQSFLTKGVQITNADIDMSRVLEHERNLTARFKHWDGETLPFDDQAFATVLVTGTPGNPAITEAFAQEILRVSKASIFLYLAPQECSQASTFRKTCESVFFEAGARKHPAYYRVNDYQALQEEQGTVAILLEKLPAQAAREYPLAALQEERDLHMDMTREPGSRSDAHIIRYMLASRFVRPGDRILDAACGLGYGSHILLKCSEAKSVLGIDGSEYAAKYAQLNFAEVNPGLTFKEGWLPEALVDIPDASIDLITSFESLEHVKDPKGLLAEFHRVLTPSGRIVLSVPNDWSDETGEDPNPFHFHVYTWEKILEETKEHFLVEAAFAQTADQFKRDNQWAVGTRQLLSTNVDTLAEDNPECEWCLLVGMKTPLDGVLVPYQETTYDLYPNNPNWQITRFDDYQNPWLVKGLVTIGHRLESAELLQKICTEVIHDAPAESPDLGAGLCVLGYQILGQDLAGLDGLHSFDAKCCAYLSEQPISQQQLRWQVSLCYLMAQLWQKWGHSEKATAYYEQCARFDCSQYSPALITKQVNAYLNLGLIASGQQDIDAAKAYWQQGVIAAEAALKLDWKAAYGSLDNPTDFGLSELGAIVECATSCAYALKYSDHAINKTPQWWHQIHRDRISQLREAETIHQEFSRLNEMMTKKDVTIRDITNTSQKEVNLMYTSIVEKDLALNQTSIEIQRLNQLIKTKDRLLSELGLEIHRLNLVIIEKDRHLNFDGDKSELLNILTHEISKVNTSYREYELRVKELEIEQSQLTTLIKEKDNTLATINQQLGALKHDYEQWRSNSISRAEHDQQLGALQHDYEQWRNNSISRSEHNTHDNNLNEIITGLSQEKQLLMQALTQEQLRYNSLRQTRLLRWRDAVAARPVTLRGLAKIVYFSVSLMTPEPLRSRLRGVVAPALNRLRKAPASPAPTAATEPESGYIVKQPKKPERNRPVVVHIIANFMTGGSSRLVVDIFEHLGNQYDQRVMTSYAPTPAAYIGIPIDEIRFPHDETPFIEAFAEIRPDFIHMHYWGDCDEPWYAKSVKAAQTLGIPVIENINTPVAPYYSDIIARYVYVSDYVRHEFGDAENTQHVTVYPGSDFSLFESKRKRISNNDCIGMVYRLENDKLNPESILPFIYAVKRKPSIRVLIVGGGSLMEPFMQAAQEAGVAENFEFMGYVPYASLPSIYERMDIFVAPVWKESFGQVSPFAMNMRVPVVGFDIGAIGEIVDDPTLLAPAGDAEALADIVVSLLNDTPRRQQIAERHRKRAQNHYSVQAMINGYRGIYNSIMVDIKK
ncbi:glycosyltransferase [Pseudomonas mosselii]|uniref:glycosyltransferase n=1 Tax=Pseudomonas mosselii TaxID=78327 RepID=UPI00300D77F8